MSSPTRSTLRTALLAGTLLVALAACGRRGPPEAPPDPTVAPPTQRGATPRRTGAADVPPGAQTQAGLPNADDEEAEPAVLVPTPRAAKNPKRGYKIPTEPFILDPLL